MARFTAYKYQSAAKLQLLTPTTTFTQFLADCLIFKMAYSGPQYLIFGALISLNFV
jgi:hypothetical protein